MPRQPVTTIDQVEREAVVGDFIRQRIADKEADKNKPKKESTNRLVITREPEGLYTVSWSDKGVLPEILRGKFTNLSRVNALIDQYYSEKGVPRPQD